MRKYWMPPRKRLLPKKLRFVTYKRLRDIPQRYLLQCHKLTLGPAGMMQDFTYDELSYRRDGYSPWTRDEVGPITLCLYRSPKKIKHKQPDTVLAWMLMDGDCHVQMFTHKKYRKRNLAGRTAVRWLKNIPKKERGSIGTYNTNAFKTLLSAKLNGLPPVLRKAIYITSSYWS